ncbi:hypothetical protein [Pseudomonas sp. URMO17WK12:I12]|uniref:hypothetical protein n=1 Tax=Pseudomonas sp. URMO17WK12:I12 TaxID=1259797 RepID=UPI000488BB16|nr:hypothetical protein [Pseudomonas sp. URMO17WK12:I12]
MNQIAQMTGGASSPAKGWLKPMFPITGKAHYFTKRKGVAVLTSHGRATYWLSLCGIDAASTDKMPMFEPGNWDRCKKCAKKVMP